MLRHMALHITVFGGFDEREDHASYDRLVGIVQLAVGVE
jgi:hypothetical protein